MGKDVSRRSRQSRVTPMKEINHDRSRGQKGKIINASSIAGHDGFAMLGVAPGIVGTDMWVEIDKCFAELTGAPVGATYKKYVGGIALGRAETPEDVAGLVPYLAGPDSDYMTGQTPLIDGGIVYR